MNEQWRLEDFVEDWERSHRSHVEEIHHCLVSGRKPQELPHLIHTVLQDYREYYDAKRRAVQEDVFQVLNPIWKSSLETAFMWMGGWRPSAAFQIALAQMKDSNPAPGTALTGLTQEQIQTIESQKACTREEEEKISRKAAGLQKTITEAVALKVSQGIEYINATIAAAKLHGLMKEKVKLLCDLFLEADELRYGSLEGMINILNPLQAAQYLVTAEVLKLAFNRVGEMKDRQAAACG